MEIFSIYGAVKSIDIPPDRVHPHMSRGFAYVDFMSSNDADKALKHMDGGKNGVSSLWYLCCRSSVIPQVAFSA